MTKLRHLKPLLLMSSRQQYNSLRFASKKQGDDGSDKRAKRAERRKAAKAASTADTPLRLEDIEEPTNCCMSGCPNCVWIQYAEKLSAVLKGSGSDVQKLIMEKVQDPNMRAFLAMELRVRKIVK